MLELSYTKSGVRGLKVGSLGGKTDPRLRTIGLRAYTYFRS
jgi:hypothetical protein